MWGSVLHPARESPLAETTAEWERWFLEITSYPLHSHELSPRKLWPLLVGFPLYGYMQQQSPSWAANTERTPFTYAQPSLHVSIFNFCAVSFPLAEFFCAVICCISPLGSLLEFILKYFSWYSVCFTFFSSPLFSWSSAVLPFLPKTLLCHWLLGLILLWNHKGVCIENYGFPCPAWVMSLTPKKKNNLQNVIFFSSFSETYFVLRGPASVSRLYSTASPGISWWVLYPFVFTAHRVRPSRLCSAYVLDHRRHRRQVMKMQSQLPHVIQVSSTTGVWRSLGSHRSSEFGHREVYPQQQR